MTAHRHEPRNPAVSAGSKGTLYTCPMYPEIRQPAPGTCPKCGMTLESVLPDAGAGESPELADFRRRFWWTLPLTVLVALIPCTSHGKAATACCFSCFAATIPDPIQFARGIHSGHVALS